jgi:Leucine-rich repeat (LRR) protein
MIVPILLIFTCSFILIACQTDGKQKQGLLDFFNSTNGWNWNVSRSWVPSSDPCYPDPWFGLSCVCDPGNHSCGVSEIRLAFSNLIGQISDLASFTDLTNLNLSFNQLSGSLPDFSNCPLLVDIDLRHNALEDQLTRIRNLSGIRNLDLSYNNLFGKIPDFVGLNLLRRLDLSFNSINETIPNFRRLPELKHLGLDSNQLTGSIPDFRYLPQLSHIDLSFNQLSGPVPDFHYLPLLSSLTLYSDRLIGSIPDFHYLPLLSGLELGGGRLTGSIPDFRYLPLLRSLTLDSNQISGSIPDLHYLPLLSSLTLYAYQLTGSIPDFHYLPQLSSLTLYAYQLTGSVPDFHYLPQLSSLTLYGDRLIGSVPDFHDLPLLSSLELGGIQLFGSIPDFRYLPSLSSLILRGNRLTGSVPNFHYLPLLSSLTLYSDRLIGSIPDFRYLPSLSSLILRGNRLTSSVPDFHYLSLLGRLVLGGNGLTGSVPNFRYIPQLNYLDLSSNQLTGSIPDFHYIPLLNYLDLSSNQLTGSIPDFHYIPLLNYLDLSSNQLTGSIPDFHYIPLLNYLYLSSNQLAGLIPDFHYIPQLNDPDLSSNQLTGLIPDFHYIPLLNYLDLSSNQLTGSIPDFHYIPLLNYLYLSSNQLAGLIPDFHYIPQLNDPDLSSNQLTGLIPDFHYIPLLNYLDLSSNQLTGSIPDFRYLPQLSILELPGNQLTGTIPSIQHMQSLSYFNISHNHLSGDVSKSINDSLPFLQLLDLSNNAFYGCINEFVFYLPNVVLLDLAENHFSGTLGDSLFDMWYLSSLSLKNNHFRGSVDGLFHNISHRRFLSFIDLSENSFQGTIPEEAFLLPSLRVLLVSKNCFFGSIPSTVCSAYSLSVLVMDGLGSSEKCQRKFFPNTVIRTYSLEHPINGPLNPCMLGLRSLNVLHLSGNGLTGSFPTNAFVSPSLVELSLSFNRLTGYLPNSFYDHQWTSFDVSFNRFKGSLKSFNNTASDYKENNRNDDVDDDHDDSSSTSSSSSSASSSSFSSPKRMSLSENRFSGTVPVSFDDLQSLDVLEGNMFECEVANGKNVLPPSDPSSYSYSCGSQNVNNSLIIWVCVAFWIIALRTAFSLNVNSSKNRKLVGFDLRNSIRDLQSHVISYYETALMWWNATMVNDCHLRGTVIIEQEQMSFVQQGFKFLRRCSVICVTLILFLFLPAFSSFTAFRSHQDSYVWIVSLAYVSGSYPAFLIFFFFLFLFLVPISLFLKTTDYCMMNLVGSFKKVLNLHHVKRSWKSFLARILTIFINNSVVLAVNIVYVYFQSSGISTLSRILIQFAVAIFKLIWSAAFVKRILLILLKEFDSSANYDVNGFGRIQLLSFLSVYNVVVVPLFATAIFDSNCFKYVFFSSAPVTLEYPIPVFISETTKTYMVGYLVDSYAGSISFTPPFIYNYQCTSTLLTEFITIFVYKYAVSMFMMLLGSLTLFLLMKYRFASDLLTSVFVPKQVHFTVLRLEREGKLWKPLAAWEKPVVRYFGLFLKEDEESYKCFDVDMIIIGLISDFSVLVTFGFVFPPLAVIVAVSIITQTVFHQLLIGRLVCELRSAIEDEEDKWLSLTAEEREKSPKWTLPEEYLAFLFQETRFIWEYFKPSIKYLAFFSSTFVSFFLFDMLADGVGLKRAIWIIPVMSLFPFLVIGLDYFVSLMLTHMKKQPFWENVIDYQLHVKMICSKLINFSSKNHFPVHPDYQGEVEGISDLHDLENAVDDFELLKIAPSPLQTAGLSPQMETTRTIWTFPKNFQ